MGRRLAIDTRATTDLLEIWLYTNEKWSPEQADRYIDQLHLGVQGIAESPESGRDRSSLLPGYWSRRIEQHVAFYTFDDAEVRIRRVLHEAMDESRHV